MQPGQGGGEEPHPRPLQGRTQTTPLLCPSSCSEDTSFQPGPGTLPSCAPAALPTGPLQAQVTAP